MDTRNHSIGLRTVVEFYDKLQSINDNEHAKKVYPVSHIARELKISATALNTFDYFTDILNRMAILAPNIADDILRELLPEKWVKPNMTKNPF